MDETPYSDQYRLDFISHLEEIRKRILICLSVISAFTIVSFLNIDHLMNIIKRPIQSRVDELIFISPTEAFSAALKISILTAFIFSFPVILYQLWRFITPAISQDKKKRVLIWLCCGLLLFFLGTSFSYFIALPAAIDFLMGFGSRIASSKITLGNYASFFGSLLLIGGIIFELPVFLAVLTEAGIISTKMLTQKRQIAVLSIFIISAVITPTQDIINLLIIAIPMYLLYEIGIIICRVIEKSHKRKK